MAYVYTFAVVQVLLKMNIYIVNFIILTSISFTFASTVKPGIISQAFQIVGRCNKEHPLDMKEMEKAVKNFELPSSEEGKCFISCFLEGFGLVTDGQINLDRSLEFNKMQFHDPDNLEKANAISAACKDEMSTSTEKGCDFAIAASKCMLEKSKEMGFRFFQFHS
ncbi:general odorant-binding protein 69a [Halyomorpha halys]|nr:Odorant-binding protein 15 isoform X1 [Halyomorpha halys]